jgi:DNA-directed RNA polymerase specialized sigma24 family protein
MHGDLQIIKIVKQGTQHARVLFSDGRRVKIPLAMAQVGRLIPAVEIVDVLVSGAVSWVHVSLRKPKRVPKVMKSLSTRVMDPRETNKKAFADLNLIRNCILHYRKSSTRNWISKDDLDDLAGDIYSHLYQRGFFDGYDPAKSAYSTWIFKAVKNFIITAWRSKVREFAANMDYLDAPIKTESPDDSGILYDLVPDRSVITSEEALMREEYIGNFRELAERMDEDEDLFDGLPSNMDIFNAMKDNLIDELIDTYVSKWQKKRFMQKYKTFRTYCEELYRYG